MAGDDRDRAEFAHRPRVAEEHAIEQRPADVGQCDGEEGAKAGGAEGERGLLVLRTLLLHQRDQLARDEGERDEDRREDEPRQREDHLHVVIDEPGPEMRLAAENEDEDQARDHRRDRERQVDQGDEEAFSPELELRDRPGSGDAEDDVQRHRDRGDRQGQAHGGERIRLADRLQHRRDALSERLDQHHRQRQHDEEREEAEREHDQRDAQRRRLGSDIDPARSPVRPRHGRISCARPPG